MSDYDAAIVGSGSGGLTAALALARAGSRVAVFEQNSLPGGYSQSFDLNGYQFSPGIHYVGQLGPGGRLREIYEGLGVANDLPFLELDPDGYDRVFVGEDRFDIPKGHDHFRARLKERFPSEARGIDGYFDVVLKMSDELRWTRPLSNWREAIRLPMRMKNILRYGLMPLDRLLDRFVSDPFLRAILSIQVGDHGMSPARAPAVLHAGLQSYYFDGGCYPHGGAHAIPETFAKHIEQHGGRVFLDAEVDRILVENGRTIGLRLADGQELRAKAIVTNTDPGVTWGRLVPREHQGALLRRRVANARYSLSTLSLFLAVDMDLRAAGFDSGNVWYSRTPDIDAAYRAAERPDLTHLTQIDGLFFNATTLKDPTLRSDGLHTVEALAVASARGFEAWRHAKPGERGASYAALKEHLTTLMLTEVDRFAPGFSDHVVYQSLSTPLTNIDYLQATEGAMYGTEKTLRNLGPFGYPIRTHLAGLFQCGASTFAPGIHGVTTSGLAAAAAVLGCAENELLDAEGQALKIYPSEDLAGWPLELRSGTRAA